MNSPKSRTTSGFTLLELLISIAIIAVLVSLLYGGLMQAGATAKTTKCIGNLRNLTSVAIAYTVDHNGYYPPTLVIKGGSWVDFWPDQLTAYLPDSEGRTPLGYPIKNSAFYCPAIKADKHGTWGDYGANSNIFRIIGGGIGDIGIIESAFRPPNITKPEKRILICDANNGFGYGSFFIDVYNFMIDPKNDRQVSLTGTILPAAHRDKYVNISFADGHIKSLTGDEIIKDAKVLLGSDEDLQ